MGANGPLGHRPALDGLRGIAIALVAMAHFLAGSYPAYQTLFGLPRWNWGGGFTGVQLFFVLSGFLITSLLLEEREATHRVSLFAFYRRRVLRLYPALVVLCLAMVAYAKFAGDPLVRHFYRGDVLGALTYTTDLGLFKTAGFLDHTWSLAVEEQFYLVWPAILILASRRGRRTVAGAALAVIVITAVARHDPRISASDIYDLLRWDALMVGCLLAAVRPHLPSWATLVGWAVIAACTVWIPSPIPPDLYLLMAIACGAVLITSLDARWLQHPILVHLGKISYSLYLWHAFVGRMGLPVLVELPLSLAAAELSYHFVERPFLRLKARLETSRQKPTGPVVRAVKPGAPV